ncbi:MAG: alpha-galactosidase [Mogibacterium sp.]|nr:alpha-galactosidase [Mogibacterium sp.]
MNDFNYSITNGTLKLSAGGIVLTGVLPYVNEKPVVPLAITSGDDFIRYTIAEGSITLRVRAEDNELVLMTSADIRQGTVHDIEPVGDAVLVNADHVYVQGYGMEGPSGYYAIDNVSRTSHGITGLCSDREAIAIFAADHRRFNLSFSVGSKKTLYSENKYLTAAFDLEGTVSGEIELPELHIIKGADVVSCMTRAAEAIASEMNARTWQEPAFHWCSWYYHYENLDQETLDGFLGKLGADPVDFRYIQIDAGYTPHIGDWMIHNHRFPGGLGKAAASIAKAGYAPGIWIAPFLVGDKSELYREHPDWIVRNKDNTPYVIFRSYTEPKIWGNTDNDYYILDTTEPEAFAYLREVFRTLRAWGYTLYKTDFILWSLVDSSRVIRYDNSLTSVEILRDAFAMIREEIGEDSYLLGSIAPFMPCIGYADGMRIAGDVGAQWSDKYGPENLLQELPFDNYFNNIFWQNDPDAVILRDFGTHLTDAETISLALLQALSGGVITTSDPVTDLTEPRKDLLRLIRPAGKTRASFPFLTNGSEAIVITHSLHDWNLFYVLNPTDHKIMIHYDLAELFGTGSLFQYRFNLEDGDDIVSERSSYLSDAIQPHGSVLLIITEEPLNVKPSNLWCRTIC